MLYGHCPFESNSIASLINTIDDTCLNFNPMISVSVGVKRFITRCLQKDCKQRIAWEELFDEVNKLLVKDIGDFGKESHNLIPKNLGRISLSHNLSSMTSDE
jgi:serine/threonine protein kinase